MPEGHRWCRAGPAAQKRTAVHGLEREMLALGFEQRFDLRDRGCRAGRQHELLRLIERHPGKRGEIEREVGLGGPADRSL